MFKAIFRTILMLIFTLFVAGYFLASGIEEAENHRKYTLIEWHSGSDLEVNAGNGRAYADFVNRNIMARKFVIFTMGFLGSPFLVEDACNHYKFGLFGDGNARYGALVVCYE